MKKVILSLAVLATVALVSCNESKKAEDTCDTTKECVEPKADENTTEDTTKVVVEETTTDTVVKPA